MEPIVHFIPLAAVISLVCSGTRNESFENVALGAIRIFLYLLAGVLLFSALLQASLQVGFLFFGLLVLLVLVLAHFTLREVKEWNPGLAPEIDGAFVVLILLALDHFIFQTGIHFLLKFGGLFLVFLIVTGIDMGIRRLWKRWSAEDEEEASEQPA